MISKLLVANRGEIAVRIFRTAHEMGLSTVAIFSDADRDALHVEVADEAVHVGGSEPSASYLDVDAILEAARRTGADAIHPGYGFLSENAAFAEAVGAAGLVFVGPTPDAIRAMGDKAEAKARMVAAHVPTVPGYFGDDQSDARLVDEAARIGTPLLVKAVAGGGGRGMRVVTDLADLPEAITSARREARNAFADDTLMLERFLPEARHIEVQVFGDTHGNVVHLGERDCTTQRRRQKVIEEAPSPALTDEARAKLAADAVQAARAIDYVGAGTVEFIVDPEQRHYFLEMNTRLQVEHPVTELVTGVDLVAWQLRVAAGEPLPLAQDAIRTDGHSIEVRLYAEDPYAGFAPQTGGIDHFRPEPGPGCRIDTGVREGDRISPFYDPMIAKLITHAHDRPTAIRKLVRLLRDTPLVGVTTNQGFLADLLASPGFVDATLHTTTLDAEPPEAPEAPDVAWALAAAVLSGAHVASLRTASPFARELTLQHRDAERGLTLTRTATTVTVGDVVLDHLELRGHTLHYAHDGVRRKAFCLRHDGVHLGLDAGRFTFRERSPYPDPVDRDDPSQLLAPVAGKVLRLELAVGDAVEADQTVAVIEAMKMETRVVARAAGVVAALHAASGDQVEADTLLVELDVG
jgi:geranyl-CoA carboxylase alpha subunit